MSCDCRLTPPDETAIRPALLYAKNVGQWKKKNKNTKQVWERWMYGVTKNDEI